MDPGRASLNAHQYWIQFPVTVYWDHPVKVSGHLMEHRVVKTADGPIPRLELQTAQGRRIIINVAQQRLLAELARLEPAVGDVVSIEYHGEAPKAAPGYSKAKEFTVEVRKRAHEAPAGGTTDPRSPALGSDNGPQPAGKAS